jgi:hypothetical protein
MNNNLAGELDKNYGGLAAYHTYLQFEDFSCRGGGLETYLDGTQVSLEDHCDHAIVYVQFEDFCCRGGGLETYLDGTKVSLEDPFDHATVCYWKNFSLILKFH